MAELANARACRNTHPRITRKGWLVRYCVTFGLMTVMRVAWDVRVPCEQRNRRW